MTTGRLAQVSAQHAIAIALRRGKAGLVEFNDDAAAETLRDHIRPDVTFIDDASRAIEAVHMLVHTHQGQTHEVDISQAKGGPGNPMTDAELEEKLVELADYQGFNRDVRAIAEAVWSLDSARDAAAVMGFV